MLVSLALFSLHFHCLSIQFSRHLFLSLLYPFFFIKFSFVSMGFLLLFSLSFHFAHCLYSHFSSRFLLINTPSALLFFPSEHVSHFLLSLSLPSVSFINTSLRLFLFTRFLFCYFTFSLLLLHGPVCLFSSSSRVVLLYYLQPLLFMKASPPLSPLYTHSPL